MKFNLLSESQINDILFYLSTTSFRIEAAFLANQLRTKQLWVIGGYDRNGLCGIAIVTNAGCIIHMSVKDNRSADSNQVLIKELFKEVYHLCAATLRVTVITVRAQQHEEEMYRSLNFYVSNYEVIQQGGSLEDYPKEMTFLINPGDIKGNGLEKKKTLWIVALSGAALVIMGLVVYIAIGITNNFIDYAQNFEFPESDFNFFEDISPIPNTEEEVDLPYPNIESIPSWEEDIFGSSYYMSGWYDWYLADDYPTSQTDEEEDELIFETYIAENLPYTVIEDKYIHAETSGEKEFDFNIKYPQIEGLGNEFEEQINQTIRDAAMNKADSFLNPSPEIIDGWDAGDYLFSTVTYEITYMDEDFISIAFSDHYFSYSEFCDLITVNINLKDGTRYYLSDILDNANEDFAQLWLETMTTYIPDCAPFIYEDASLFQQVLEAENYEDRYVVNFFVTKEGIRTGFSFQFRNDKLVSRGWETAPFKMEALEPFKKESDFWNLIDTP